MPRPCHALTMPFFSRPQHSTAVSQRPCCALALRIQARSEHGMASMNQTRPHCVNQIGKTHSKPLAARYGRGTSWARHAMCESAFNVRGTEQTDGMCSAQESMCGLHYGLCYYQMFGILDTCGQRAETENVCSISFAFCTLIK